MAAIPDCMEWTSIGGVRFGPVQSHQLHLRTFQNQALHDESIPYSVNNTYSSKASKHLIVQQLALLMVIIAIRIAV